MPTDIHSILKDLYAMDPDLKKHEKDLEKLVEQLMEAKPDLKIDEDFVKSLRRELDEEAGRRSQTEALPTPRPGLRSWFNRFFFPFAGGVLATILVAVAIQPPKNMVKESLPMSALSEEAAVESEALSDVENESLDVSSEALEMTMQDAPPSDVVTQIGEQIQDIDAGLATCNKTEVELWGRSTEGGLATYYEKEGKVRKIKEELLGETGKIVTKYYFVDEELIYIAQERHAYNRPIYWDEEMAIEMGDSEVFDPEQSTITQSEYYFEADSIVHETNESGETVPLDLSEADLLKARAHELLWEFHHPEKDN